MINNKKKNFMKNMVIYLFQNQQNYLEDSLKQHPEKDKIARKNKEIELIKEKYSSRVLIIDEVHNVRTVDPKSIRIQYFILKKL